MVTERRLILSVILAWSLLAFPMILLSFYTNDLLRSILPMLTTFLSIFILTFCRITTYYEARNQLWKIKTKQISAAGAATFFKREEGFLIPPFSLIRDFGKQNTRGNVSKISVSLACYLQIGSKSTNHSH